MHRVAQIATVLLVEQRQRGVSIPKPARRARCAAYSHIAVVGAGMLRATRRYVSMRPVEGSRDTGLPAADIVENLKYFSPIPFRPRPPPSSTLPRVLSSLVFATPADYQINKGEYQIKLRL